MGLGDKRWWMGEEEFSWEGYEFDIMGAEALGIASQQDVDGIIRANCGCQR